MEYTEKQTKAIETIADRWETLGRKALVTVAGYAGTGKTTIVRAAIREIGRRHRGDVKVKFACYTGKAARVLQSKLRGEGEVCTMHRLLYDTYPIEYFDQDNNPNVDMRMLEREGVIRTRDFVHIPKYDLDCDVVVIDEASMVPLILWNTLRKHSVMVICLGDPAQLPPVEDKDADVNGTVAKEPVFPMTNDHDAYDVFLDEIMRQNADSGIIQLSMQARMLPPLQERKEYMNKGMWCEPMVGSVHRDYFVTGKTSAAMQLQIYINALKMDGTDTSKHVMLCFRNSSRIALNKHIHKALGYKTEGFEPGERVVCLRNSRNIVSNRHNTLVNGLMGICLRTHYNKALGRMVMDIDADGEIFRSVPLEMVDWAYCLTVHKSQGSEWENVLLLDEWYELWLDPYAQWLYTGITRAQKYLIITKAKVTDMGVEVKKEQGDLFGNKKG